MKNKALLKKISSGLTSLLFIFLLCMLFLVFISKVTGNEGNLFGYQLKTVLSGSMEPKIDTGSIISIKTGGDMTRFHRDDVITFNTKDDMIVTHRITEVLNDGEQYITKGDANDGHDLNPVLSENIIGYYTGFTIPYVGYVINFASSREGVALLLILPGFLLLTYSYIIIRRTLRQVKEVMDEKDMKTGKKTHFNKKGEDFQ
ncbi:MAG: signal peptidase I SipW [Bacillota bacterium]